MNKENTIVRQMECVILCAPPLTGAATHLLSINIKYLTTCDPLTTIYL